MSRRTLVVSTGLGVILGLGVVCCRGVLVKPESVDLGEVEDVLSGPTTLDALAVAWPVDLLVVEARALDAGREWRRTLAAGGPLVLVVDAGDLESFDQDALADRLVEPALDDAGPIVIDRNGDVARALGGVLAPPVLVRLEEGGAVAARIALDAASARDELHALGRPAR